VTNDGVSIARAIKLDDKFEQMGAWLVNNTCDKTFDDVGDSTTTTAVLLQAIIDESLKRPENPIHIRRSLKDTGKKIEQWIKNMAKDVKDTHQICNVATVAAESSDIGQLIANVIDEAGKNTPIYIEDNTMSPTTEYSIVNGLETQNGYISSNTAVIDLEDVYVFVTDKRIESLLGFQDVLKVMEANQITSPIIVCPDIDENVYKFFTKLNASGALNYTVIRAKGTDLIDIASYVGATIISTTTGLDFKDTKLEHFGKAERVVVTDRKSLITAKPNDICEKAVKKLEDQIEQTKNVYEKQHLNKRLEALMGGVAIIKVGAPTDTERADLRLKILNAVNTTKSAIQEGIVEGGGMCLYRVANQIKGGSIGEEILKTALKAPLKNIIENAGEDYTDVVRRISSAKGYNATTNKTVYMFKEGIVDSAKATRCAFTNALSSASEFITSGVAITNNKNETNKQ
jgi:chaperonin GroEL